MTGKCRILVVEDNDFVRMQVVRFLEEAGYETVEASDGEAALQEISNNIDLAVVDVRMEPMGGFEFINTIRGLDMDLEVPVILVTGDKDPELLHDATVSGVSAVLMKPVERDRLVKTVEKTVRAGVKD